MNKRRTQCLRRAATDSSRELPITAVEIGRENAAPASGVGAGADAIS